MWSFSSRFHSPVVFSLLFLGSKLNGEKVVKELFSSFISIVVLYMESRENGWSFCDDLVSWFPSHVGVGSH